MTIESGNASAAERSRRQPKRADVGASLRWQRVGNGWRLFEGRRRFGEIVPDAVHPNMWRPVLADGRLGDLANITWAKHAVFEAAVRELEWEAVAIVQRTPQNAQKRGVFLRAQGRAAVPMGGRPPTQPSARWSGRNEQPPPTRSAVLVERRALPNWRIHRERQQSGEAFERSERERLGLPPRHRSEPPRSTGPTRRDNGAVRELMDPSREATGADAAGGRPSKRPPRRASLRGNAGRSWGGQCGCEERDLESYSAENRRRVGCDRVLKPIGKAENAYS
jgi:hypothetical protein